MRIPFLLFLVLRAALACAQQTPPAAERTAVPLTQKKEKLCRIAGRTVHALTGEPVRKVNLVLYQVRMESKLYSAVSNGEGQFFFDNIEPGTYDLMAERAGFLHQAYGFRGVGFIGTSLTLAANQELKDLEFKLTPQGVITGKLLDEEGEPVERASINVFRQVQFGGLGRPSAGGSGSINDVGDYRVADLRPGRYIVQAIPPPPLGGEPETAQKADQVREAQVPTFYPGVTDPASAAVVDVGPGQEVSGINITLRKSHVYRVFGTVAGGTAGHLKMMHVSLFPPGRKAMTMFSPVASGRVNADGTFAIGRVQPGSYNLRLMLEGDDWPHLVGRAQVDVVEGDVEGVVVRLSQSVALRGSVRVEGTEKAKVHGVRLVLLPCEGIPVNPHETMVKEDGTFRMENVTPDRYYVLAANVPEGTYLKSVRFGNQEAPDRSIDLSQAQGRASIELVLSPDAGTVEGSVMDDGKPVPGSSVLLVPEPPRPEESYRWESRNTDQYGRFSIKGLTPGECKLYASSDWLTEAMIDPQLLQPFEERAVKVTVAEKGRERVEIELLKPRDASTP